MTGHVHYLHSDAVEVAREAGRRAVSIWSSAHQNFTGAGDTVRIEPFGPWQFIVHTPHPRECADAAHEAAGDGMRVESTIVDGGVVLTIRRRAK